MTLRAIRRPLALAALGAFAASAALAHHGWTWAEEKQTELTGEILEIYIGPPHPVLQVASASEGRWTVELGNPRQTEASGFVEGSAQPGEKIVVRGHRSLAKEEKRIKAVRITVEGRRYDLYPDRIVED